MIIYNLNILRCPTLPAKTDPPLVIDSDAVLAFSLAFQSFQSVAWRRSQISKLLLRRGGIKACVWPPPGCPTAVFWTVFLKISVAFHETRKM
jgi:hypothetical protein